MNENETASTSEAQKVLLKYLRSPLPLATPGELEARAAELETTAMGLEAEANTKAEAHQQQQHRSARLAREKALADGTEPPAYVSADDVQRARLAASDARTAARLCRERATRGVGAASAAIAAEIRPGLVELHLKVLAAAEAFVAAQRDEAELYEVLRKGGYAGLCLTPARGYGFGEKELDSLKSFLMFAGAAEVKFAINPELAAKREAWDRHMDEVRLRGGNGPLASRPADPQSADSEPPAADAPPAAERYTGPRFARARG